jgi:hypothetical protein
MVGTNAKKSLQKTRRLLQNQCKSVEGANDRKSLKEDLNLLQKTSEF